ncbi:MAG: ATP-binding cassette domain-containing protein [Salibaculum sp.]|jgi:oligopeptide transport system ATP-binding protein|uniref:oligopeptide/dipeptide ABC transporter ATP-binding protein n=1 Tax=Roseovarius halophilus (ex Wu et al. 2025) TaxID=3376060 RepID=UPI00286FEDF5|nr:oligopeptide/dipeptide ABC transporter ATP-binding protein [Salibaculum sp.]MDR9427436.1 ATP-binding cassette domain-containing protein [Salibaculum sp.]MDR9481815.1 ATP-binding cassette domain-containing protein [Salibaculum sp.]
MALLDVSDLTVTFQTNDGPVNAVNGLDFTVARKETLAIVGESGSGKSQTAFAIMGLLARNGGATGRVAFEGNDLLSLSRRQLNKVRSNQIGMIFQDPMTSLNPYIRVSDQMAEVLQLHKGLSKRDAIAQAVQMLDAVRIPDAKSRISMYPHEFSGGMRQRIMIAMALLCRPRLLIADEPTTALDVTVQAQIMKLLGEIREEFNTAVILITHDLGIVADFCDRTLVLYGGQIMEEGPTAPIFADPSHPYTAGLLGAVPRLDREMEVLQTISGEPPDMSNLPAGCPFSPRCEIVREHCPTVKPGLEALGDSRRRACHASPAEMKQEMRDV